MNAITTPSDTLTDADLAATRDDEVWAAVLSERVRLEAEPTRRRIDARKTLLEAQALLKQSHSQYKHRNISKAQHEAQTQYQQSRIDEATAVITEANAVIAAIRAETASLRQRRYRALYPHIFSNES